LSEVQGVTKIAHGGAVSQFGMSAKHPFLRGADRERRKEGVLFVRRPQRRGPATQQFTKCTSSPMQHKTRIVLFYLFVAAFLIGGTGVLLYSYGWRFSTETKTFQKIGAIYIKTNVRDTAITINGKPYKDAAGILQSGTLISNLLPKTYRVEITKDGYHTYHKTLTVKPSQVEELLNVQLIPKQIERTFIAPTKGTRLVDTMQTADKMILQDTATGIYYLYDKTNASSTLNLSLAAANAQRGLKIKKVSFVPFKPTQFVIEDASGLKLFDSEKKTVEVLLKGSLATWNMQDSTIVGVELVGTGVRPRTQRAFTLNLIFKSKALLGELNAHIATTTVITALSTTGSGSMAFSDTAYALSLFDPKTKTIRRVSSNVTSFTFSPDGKKLAFVEATGEASVLFIEDFNGDIRKKAGEIIAIALPQEKPVQTVHWHRDSYHLLIEWTGELAITELDDRKPLNTFLLISGFTDYRYVAENDSVYFIDNKGINTIRIEH